MSDLQESSTLVIWTIRQGYKTSTTEVWKSWLASLGLTDLTKSGNMNFPNIAIHPELNCGCIERIKNLVFIGHCGVLDAPRLSSVVLSTILSSFTYFLV